MTIASPFAGFASWFADDTHQASLEAIADSWPELRAVGTTFGLTVFERELLGLCAAVECDPALAARCAALHGDPSRPWVSFGLALARLSEPHWSALAPAGPLRYWRLVAVDPQPTLTTGRISIDERVLHHLLGTDHLDEQLRGIVREPGPDPEELAPSQDETAAQVASLCRDDARTVVQLVGPAAPATRAVARRACAQLGLLLRLLPAAALPSDARGLSELRLLWQREAALSGSALLVEAGQTSAEERRLVADLATGLQSPLFVATRDPFSSLESALVCRVERPRSEERHALWTAVIGPRAGELNGVVEQLGEQFELEVGALRSAGREALARCEPGSDLGRALWRACRNRSRPALDELAQRLDPEATLADLVLPQAQLEQLRQIVAQVRRRGTVYAEWGFAAKSSRGLGISALFAGASGTGKTMAAEALARALDLDLYRIDLSGVVSKYIGETEKNLRRVFDAAETGGAVLLFDEADALFGKRAEVKDSHDRYANIEVSYLLQRMESYRGLAILTTNLKDSLDPAFLRRLRFVVSFPFPDLAARTEIWERIFPTPVPRDGIVPAQLARLTIAGGNIRNVALGAAFLAADEDAPVRMHHLLAAARSEYAKLERPLTSTELEGWS